MKAFFKEFANRIIEKKYYYLPISFFFIIIFFTVLLGDKIQLFLYINKKHNHFFDGFFKMITYSAEKYLMVMVIFLVIIFKRITGLKMLFVFGIPAVISLLLKHLCNLDRPSLIIDTDLIHFPSGVYIKETNSFPSGHATIVFALITFFIHSIKHQWFSWILFLWGVLVCYSRLYLGQHFLEDVFVGALIGQIFGIIGLVCFEKLKVQARLDKFKK